MRKLLLITLLTLLTCSVKGQFTYGTTGLLNMPTADMQKDKTFLFGGGYLEKHATPGRWNYNTYNYYINITFFPWLEVGYTCTLHKSIPYDPMYGSGFWLSSTYGKFVNQDRNFSGRIRIWKEGWWKDWTPQIVIGGNDALHNSWEPGSKIDIDKNPTNGFYNRYYISATKHYTLNNIGNFGVHLAWIYNKRSEYKLNGLCFGTNFQFKLKKSDAFWSTVFNGLNLMLEAYPADGQGTSKVNAKKHFDRGLHIGKYDINTGLCYSFWKERINFYGELYGCKDFSAGLQFKICLK